MTDSHICVKIKCLQNISVLQYLLNYLQLIEVPLPMRFIFIYMQPTNHTANYHEIGRSMGTLLSNPVRSVRLAFNSSCSYCFIYWVRKGLCKGLHTPNSKADVGFGTGNSVPIQILVWARNGQTRLQHESIISKFVMLLMVELNL